MVVTQSYALSLNATSPGKGILVYRQQRSIGMAIKGYGRMCLDVLIPGKTPLYLRHLRGEGGLDFAREADCTDMKVFHRPGSEACRCRWKKPWEDATTAEHIRMGS
jgi:hypothetical protein